jgi:malonyl-CoA/methylmalonyl-CoA synthetase
MTMDSLSTQAMLDAARQNVYAAFAARFPADHDRVFIENFDGRRIRYADVAAGTARLSQALGACGVGKGDRVAGIIEKSPEAILLYLACCRMGAVYLPVHTGLTWPEVTYILDDSEPVAVVCAPHLAARVEAWAAVGAKRHVFTLDTSGKGSLIEAGGRFGDEAPVAEGGADDPNAIVYTSGTTGRQKGAVMTNGLVIWNALALADRWRITPDDRLLHANPAAFSLFGTTTPMLAGGARMRLLPKFDADAVVAAMPGATMFSGVPTYYSRLLAHPGFTADRFRDMRLFITGSAPMRADTFDAFAARTGRALLDRYGMTEALIITSMCPDEPRRPDASGRPLAGSMVRVVDADGRPVPAGTVGAIELLQPFMFGGYWKAPEKTRAAFRPDGWFITGDFGRLDADGMLCVLGRGVDLIISGGFNVYPKEVEARLNGMANVADSAVIGVPHPDFGEAVVALVELADPAAGFSPPQVQAEMARGLAKYKVPKHIAVVGALPRNTLGKVQKNQLKRQFAGLYMPAPV